MTRKIQKIEFKHTYYKSYARLCIYQILKVHVIVVIFVQTEANRKILGLFSSGMPVEFATCLWKLVENRTNSQISNPRSSGLAKRRDPKG